MSIDIVVAHTAEDIDPHVPAWTALLDDALEPNVFYEPWMLRPALEHLRGSDAIEVVLLYDCARPPLLLGAFPIARAARYRRLPLHGARLWKHPHCFLSTPHLRRERAHEALQAFLDWAAGEKIAMFEFMNVTTAGAFHRVLVDVLNARGAESVLTRSITRPLFVPGSDTASFLKRAMSGGSVKELRRKERRLGECGQLVYEALDARAAPQPWIAEFLELEASGWKRRDGGALALRAAHRRFFEAVVSGAHARGRLQMGALRLDGRAVAFDSVIRAREGAYGFKSAIDEALGRFSPGAILMMHTIRRLHDVRLIEWVDSCAAPDSTLSRFFPDRVAIQSVLVATRSGYPSALVAAVPLLRLAMHALRGEERP